MIAIQKEYQNICNKYVSLFCEKHGLTFQFWEGHDIGWKACFKEDREFDFDDIRLDIDTNQPKENIINWDDYNYNMKDNMSYRYYLINETESLPKV